MYRVCCAVTESGTANATKNIVFVMHVNFLEFMAASSNAAGSGPKERIQSNCARERTAETRRISRQALGVQGFR